MKGIKTVPLTVLALVFYALSNLLQFKVLLFPIPANDYVALIVLSYLYFINRKDIAHGIFLILFLCFAVMQNPYNLELFLSNPTLNYLTKGIFFDLISFLALSFLLVYVFLSTKNNINKKVKPLLYLALSLLIASLFFLTNYFQSIAFILLSVFYTLSHRQTNTLNDQFNQHVFILLSFLKLTFIYSLNFI